MVILKILATIGFDAKYKYLSLTNGERIKIIFEDASGQGRYRSLSFNFIRKANGVVLMYDITKKNKFKLLVIGVNKFGNIKKRFSNNFTSK